MKIFKCFSGFLQLVAASVSTTIVIGYQQRDPGIYFRRLFHSCLKNGIER